MTKPGDGDKRRPGKTTGGRDAPTPGEPTVDEDVTHLVQALQIHQIELELQNEEMHRVRQQLEEGLARYTDLYDFAPVAYVTVGSNGIIRKVNLAAARLLSQERSHLIGRELQRYVSVSSHGALGSFLERLHTSGFAESCDVVLPRDGADPLEVQLEGHGTQGRGELRIIMVDVTEKKRLIANVLLAMQAEPVRLLAGGIAGDFNNLLTAMTMNINSAQEQASMSHASLRQTLADTLSMVTHAAGLVKQISSFSAQREPYGGRFDSDMVVRESVTVLGRLLRDDIALQHIVEPDAGDAWLEGDPALVHKMLMNLFVNAVNSMPAGGRLTLRRGRVTLDAAAAGALTAGARPGSYVRLQVSDTGRGIDPRNLDRIFDPFFIPTGSGQSTGLALAMVNSDVVEHHGFVTVGSQLGEGSTFSVFLPQVAPPTLHKPVMAPVAGGQPLPPIRILLAEENAILAGVLSNVLARHGHHVLSAGNAEEAYRIWNREGGRFDVLVTEASLPGAAAGLDLVKQCRRENPGLGVVMTGGNSLDALRGEAWRGAANQFLRKPFDVGLLLKAVAQARARPA